MQAEKLEWSLAINDDRIALQLIGELSRHTLLPLWKEFQQKQQRFAFLSHAQMEHTDIYWNLAGITRIDSAGFALLCEMIANCRKMQSAHVILRLENVPPQLFTLADLFNLDDWLKSFI
ncbi:MAG: STAS domain-containing protein [Lonepinella koalarum]|nr:STAS domain-containing protein [Lonepinella koalarum]